MEDSYILERTQGKSKRWRALIQFNRTDVKLGLFDFKDQAITAIKAALVAKQTPDEFEDWYENYKQYTLGYKIRQKVILPCNVKNRLKSLSQDVQEHIAGKYYGCRKVWNE